MDLTRAQLNVRIRTTLAAKIRGDARKHNKSVDSVVEAIMTEFYVGRTDAGRKLLFAPLPDKRRGRS